MAKDMSDIYKDMLTKELVRLRARHEVAYRATVGSTNRKERTEALKRADLIRQIEHELANRIASFGLFV